MPPKPAPGPRAPMLAFVSDLLQTLARQLRPAEAAARLRTRIWWGVGSLLGLLWLLFLLTTVQQLDVAGRAAAANTATLTRLIEAWALSTLGRIEDLAAAVEPQLEGKVDEARLTVLLMRQRRTNPTLFLSIDVVATDGTLLATSAADDTHGIARNFDSDVEAGGPISIGLRRPVGGNVQIPIQRMLIAPDGSVLGAVIVEVDPAYFAGFYSDLGLPPDTSAMLFRADGPLLAANRPDLGILGHAYPSHPMWPHVRQAPSGSFEAFDIDGVDRAISYRVNGKIPLIVSIGRSMTSIWADMLRRSLVNALIGFVLSAAIILVTIFAVRQLERRAQTEQALSIAASAIASVGSGVAIIATGPDKTVVQVNPAFTRLTGFAREEIERTSWDRLELASDSWPWLDDRHREAAAEVAIETSFRRKDGTAFWAELRASPIRSAGLTTHVVFVLTDLSERKRAENDLVEAKDQAVAASRAKSEFLANMSHELRTPLNAIIGFADIIVRQLMGPIGTARYVAYARDIWMSGSHLLQIISDILDLAKIEASQLMLDESAIDVARVFAACRMLAAERAVRAKVELEIDCPADLPALTGDELRVKQIVLNLLTNAVKFSEAGGCVALRARLDADGALAISVADEGCGMSEDDVRLALQPFRQVSSSVAKRGEGTGLGLPLVVRLAELHGGRLELRSAPGAGTTATVRFPPARTRRAAAAA
jgi:PAS domain S-box-containing protein